MPGRAPRHDVDDLAVTHDELAPVDTRPPVELPELEAVEVGGLQVRPLGSDDFPATEAEGWEWSRRLRAEIAEARAIAVEADRKATAAKPSLLRRFGVPTASWTLGVVSAVLVYAFGFARDQGDAAGAKRERESAWVQVLHDVRELRERQAVVFTRLDGLDNLLRLYFPAGAVRLQGPTIDPRPVSPPP